jgi:hypothetical protein
VHPGEPVSSALLGGCKETGFVKSSIEIVDVAWKEGEVYFGEEEDEVNKSQVCASTFLCVICLPIVIVIMCM